MRSQSSVTVAELIAALSAIENKDLPVFVYPGQAIDELDEAEPSPIAYVDADPALDRVDINLFANAWDVSFESLAQQEQAFEVPFLRT